MARRAVSRNPVALCDRHGALLVAAGGMLVAANTGRRRGPTQDRAAEESGDAHGALPRRLHTVRPVDLHITRSLTRALRDKGFSPPDWGSGLWQDVLHIYRLRKEYVHPNIAQERLFAPVEEAEKVIATLRLAIKDMYSRTGTPQEAWPDDDQNPIDPRRGFVAHLTVVGHGTVVEGGARREDSLRICYVMNGQEYEDRLMQPDKDYRAHVDELLRKIPVPISAVRVYRANEQVRRSSSRCAAHRTYF